MFYFSVIYISKLKFTASDKKEYIVFVKNITSITKSEEYNGTTISLSCGSKLDTLHPVNEILRQIVGED